MLRSRRQSAILFFLLLGFTATTHAQSTLAGVQPEHGSVRARQIYDTMMETIQSCSTLSFTSNYSYQANGTLEGECGYRVWLKKPGLTRLDLYRCDSLLTGVLLADGEAFRIYRYSPNQENKHSHGQETGWLGSSIVMTALQYSIFHGGNDSLMHDLDSVIFVREEVVHGEACEFIEVRYLNGRRSRFYWISKLDHLPRIVKDVTRTGNELAVVEHWGEFEVNRAIDDTFFAWLPAPDWKQWSPP